MTARIFQLHGSNDHATQAGNEDEISNLYQYGWFDWCYYREQTYKLPFNKEVIGKSVVSSKVEGNDMDQWILKETVTLCQGGHLDL